MSIVENNPGRGELIHSRLDEDYDELIQTVRFRVPGGWLYRSTIAVPRSVAVCQTFIKDDAA